MSENHQMVLSGYTESGAEEWTCPSCGRRMLLRWPPNFERLVLEQGNPGVTHSCGKGGARAAAAVTPPAGPASHERQWLRDNGIDWDAAAG